MHLKPAMPVDPHTKPIKVRILCQNLYIAPPKAFKKVRGPSANSSFRQISMRRLTGVPRAISDGTGWVGSGWAGIWKGWGSVQLKTG